MQAHFNPEERIELLYLMPIELLTGPSHKRVILGVLLLFSHPKC